MKITIVTYWNNAAEQLFGWSKEEVMGKHSKGIFQTKVPDSSREEAIKKMLKKIITMVKYIINTKMGTIF